MVQNVDKEGETAAACESHHTKLSSTERFSVPNPRQIESHWFNWAQNASSAHYHKLIFERGELLSVAIVRGMNGKTFTNLHRYILFELLPFAKKNQIELNNKWSKVTAIVAKEEQIVVSIYILNLLKFLPAA